MEPGIQRADDIRILNLQTELQTLSDNTEEAIISIGESVAKITVELRGAVAELREHVAEIQRELAVYRAPSWIKPGAKIISHELGWAVNEPINVVGEPYWQPGWGWLVKAESCDPDVLARMIAHGIGPRPTRCDLLAEGSTP